MTRNEAGIICLLHAKVARAFSFLMRERDGTPAFDRRMSEWLQADLDFLAEIANLTEEWKGPTR